MENTEFKHGDKVMLKLSTHKHYIFIEEVEDRKAKCIDSDGKEVIVYLATIQPYVFQSFL